MSYILNLVNEVRSDTYRDILFDDFKENKIKDDMRQAAVENYSEKCCFRFLQKSFKLSA